MTATTEATAHTITGISAKQFEALDLVFNGDTARLMTASGTGAKAEASFADVHAATALITAHRDGLDKKTGFPGQQLNAVLEKIHKTFVPAQDDAPADAPYGVETDADRAKVAQAKAAVAQKQKEAADLKAAEEAEKKAAALAKEKEAKRKAEAEATEWITVDRKRRYANVITQVWNLAHAECPEAPKVFEDLGANGPVFEWAAVCLEHDEKGFYRRKDIAEANAADPWIFCGGCAHTLGGLLDVARTTAAKQK
ncbi:hypothetical protein [Actinomadura rayongensis]|uniref:Uncharacterized protein n=1 Tax=Actinomadura rayongensis TaxID=1429076 RepID=A0A6I4WDC1_9ACTN|nr:hypothetical protein [Actinomadura rayongensis]MXQ67718.1 hypothetical protein [Actinomadura rayongensis]